MSITEPVFDKNQEDVRDYKELSFGDFIKIQQAAQQVADSMGFPLYLVGSAQYKHLPRDIDISLIMPSEEYIKRYTNCGPYNISECTTINGIAGAYIANAFYKEYNKHLKPIIRLQFDGYMLDFKICPDNWFTDKPKTILATPKEGKE